MLLRQIREMPSYYLPLLKLAIFIAERCQFVAAASLLLRLSAV